jgi:IclR family KDG regulon transcriptional repressor
MDCSPCRRTPLLLVHSMAESPNKKTNRYRVEAVDRALVLLDTLASSTVPMTVSQLADHLGANRSLVFRMLSTLSDRGFVARDPDNLYSLGPTLLYLGLRAERGNGLIEASRDVLDALVKATQENVQLVVRDGFDVVGLALRVAPQPVRLAEAVATRGHLYEGGVHKLLLAYAPQEIIDEVVERHLGEFMPATLRSRKKIMELLVKIREEGSYSSIGAIHPDIYTLSVPITDGRRAVSAALSIMGPSSRLDSNKQKQFRRLLLDGAAQIAARLR